MEIEDRSANPPGFDRERLKKIGLLLESGIEHELFPSAVYTVLRNGQIVAKGALGQPQPDGRPGAIAKIDTIYDLASITKAFVAILLLQCIENGELHLRQRLADWFPDAAGSELGKVTLHQLATHVSGLPAWKPLHQSQYNSAFKEILDTPLEREPGRCYTYSDLNYILLGEILRLATETNLDRLAQARIFGPLGMHRTTFCPPEVWSDEIAACANCGSRPGEILVGQVHDPNAFSLKGVAGHAGIFSSARDLARLAVSFRYPMIGASLGIPSVLGTLALTQAETNQIDPSIGGHSIGWFASPNPMLPRGDLLSTSSFGHTGFTGTMLLFDPQNGLTLILLTNRVYYPGEGTGVIHLRRIFANIVAGALL